MFLGGFRSKKGVFGRKPPKTPFLGPFGPFRATPAPRLKYRGFPARRAQKGPKKGRERVVLGGFGSKKGVFHPKQAFSGLYGLPLAPGSNIGVFQPEGPKKGSKKGQKRVILGWFWVEKGCFPPKTGLFGPVRPPPGPRLKYRGFPARRAQKGLKKGSKKGDFRSKRVFLTQNRPFRARTASPCSQAQI